MKENSLFQYLFSRDFWKQIRMALAIFFGIIFFISICLWVYTRHNSSRPVPDFKGLSRLESVELADDNSLRIQVIDSVYNQDQKPGTVVEQEPKPGIHVKKHRRIFLVINAMNPEKINMPNVVGVSVRQAVAILESNGLSAGHLSYVTDIATNSVLKQKYKGKEIKPGIKINKGSHIDLLLGRSGNYEMAKVPNLIGMKLRRAERMVAQSSLNIGKVVFDKSVINSQDSIIAVVVKQMPAFSENGQLALGAFVNLWLSKENKNSKNEPKKDE